MTHGLDTSFLLAVEIVEHTHHAEALRLLGELLARGDRVAIAPQVLTEFVHVVTDARRFQQPFSMETALNKSERWWNAAEADQVLPTDVAIALFHTCGDCHCQPDLSQRSGRIAIFDKGGTAWSAGQRTNVPIA